MLDKFKFFKKDNDELKFPVSTPHKNVLDPEDLEMRNEQLKFSNQYQPFGKHSTLDDKILNNEIFLNKLTSLITANNYFIQMMTMNLESQILKTLETRYDFTPTDKLKQLVESGNSELIRINSALADKTEKLAIVESKIEQALQNMTPEINKMLTKIAHSVLHDTGTNVNKFE